MSLFFALAMGGAAGTVTLTADNYTNSDGSPVGDQVGGVRINYDGTIDQIGGDTGAGGPTYVQQNASTDWCIPNSGGSRRTTHFKLDTVTGDALNASSAAVNSWVELTSAGLDWYYQEPSTNKSGTSTLRVSRDGGSTEIDTSAVTFGLENVV